MNILFITTKSPLPLSDGHSLRSFNLLKQIAAQHTVHLLSFVKHQCEYQSIPELEALCCSVELFSVPDNRSRVSLVKTLFSSFVQGKPYIICKYDIPQMRKAICQKVAHSSIDLIHFDMLPLAVYLPEALGKVKVLNEHNVESSLLARRAAVETGWLKKTFFKRQQRLLEVFEVFACENVDTVLSCSIQDSEKLKEFSKNTPVEIIPNGVDTRFFSAASSIKEVPETMIFVGGLDWFPNRDALQWFDREIFPLILKEYPHAHLNIIGKKGGDIEWIHEAAITCHGFVEDIRPHMAQASIFIVPLRIGGGTRLKILNAMAMGKIVVSTEIGAEGLGLISGTHALLLNPEREFANAVKNIFNNRESYQDIPLKGRCFVKERYQWDSIGKKVVSVYEELCTTPFEDAE